MTYRAPISDMLLSLNHGAGLKAAVEAGHYGDFDGDIVSAVLEEAGKFATDVLAPLNQVGDEHGIKLSDGKVTTAPGWPDAYKRWTEGGWNAVSGPEDFGGQGLPIAINAACTEIWSASNVAFGLCPLLTASAMEALDAHGSDELKKIYLEKLVSGEWTGTMQLTEPQAGSDVGALRTRAEQAGRRHLSHQGDEDLHHLWRARHDRQHRAFRAGAPAGRARGHQGDLAVPRAEVHGQCRRLARRAQ